MPWVTRGQSNCSCQSAKPPRASQEVLVLHVSRRRWTLRQSGPATSLGAKLRLRWNVTGRGMFLSFARERSRRLWPSGSTSLLTRFATRFPGIYRAPRQTRLQWGRSVLGNASAHRSAINHAHSTRSKFIASSWMTCSRKELDEALPLFPTSTGATAEKEKVVKLIELVACSLGLPVVSEESRRVFGGHSLRVSGAQWMARMNVPLSLIQLMARWASDVIAR